MEITDIRICKVDGSEGDNVKAYVSVIFENIFVVDNIKIIEDNNKIILAMPNRNIKGRFSEDIDHPTTSAFMAKFQKQILEKYNDSLSCI